MVQSVGYHGSSERVLILIKLSRTSMLKMSNQVEFTIANRIIVIIGIATHKY